jgi:hypothetical protein
MARTIRAGDTSRLPEVDEPLGLLMMAITMSVPEIDEENLFDLIDELVARFGSIEAATTAMKSGEVALGSRSNDDRSQSMAPRHSPSKRLYGHPLQ